MGQWNFTLTSATTRRRAEFVNVLGITNCSSTFGYVGDMWSYDWDSGAELGGGRTISEIKYLLSECFNATYKLSSEHADAGGSYYDLSSWFPFSGVDWADIQYLWNNTWIERTVVNRDSRNTTFLYGESDLHNGMLFTREAASVVDVVGGTEVGMAFGDWIRAAAPCTGTYTDPWYEAMWDTSGFMGEAYGPFYGVKPDFYMTVPGKVYIDDPVTELLLSWTFSGFRRVQNRTCGASEVDWDLFTTPTGALWDVNHTICIGGPKVNLGSEYFNDHTWAVWTSAESGCEIPELEDGGIYAFASGNAYGEGFSVITIAEDLNLTSWTAIFDEETRVYAGGLNFTTDPNYRIWDGPTLVDPYAGLLVWGVSGWDTRAASNWLAQYWHEFNKLYTNATHVKRGVTTIILYTPNIAKTNTKGWTYGIREILGPVAGRWRHSVAAWDVWITVPCSIDWIE